MKQEEQIKALKAFQKNAFKAFRTLGFGSDNTNTIFGIIIEMRNLVLAAEQQDTILLHKFMGLCSENVANYCTVNDLKLECVVDKTHALIEEETSLTDLEEYLQKIRQDLSFIQDMKESEKIEFVQKCWVCIFPEEYCEDFIKIDRILKATIENNKIKYPQAYFESPSAGGKYGLE